MGKESVLADSGWEGEITARVGRVRSLNFLNVLLGISCFMPDMPRNLQSGGQFCFPLPSSEAKAATI
jgi:hypothetical protein